MRPCDADTEEKLAELTEKRFKAEDEVLISVDDQHVSIYQMSTGKELLLTRSEFDNSILWYMKNQTAPKVDSKIDGHFRTVITPGKQGEP